LEYLAGLVMWICVSLLCIFPAIIGGNLIYISFHGGVDGLPSSGDSQTDRNIGIACCVASAFFMLVSCCMAGAMNKAVKSVESAAACMFHARSLLLEPVINLMARLCLWTCMLAGFAWLISTGEVRKSKIYRTFTYTQVESVYLVFYIIMMVWLNDFCNAMSQYVIASATAKWYFTEHIGGSKMVPDCLLCKGYMNGWFYHLGSLAFGSLVICFTRPVRIILLVLVYAGEMVPACGCISSLCSCCTGCFESCLAHISKNAYIEMAISSKGFCAAGNDAARVLKTENKAIAALSGATWLFTITGLAAVTSFSASITSFIVQNTETFSSPTSKYYIQDPMVMAACAGSIAFVVALCFMLVFDSVADTLLLCMAYDLKDQRENPVPMQQDMKQPAAANQSIFASFFSTAAPVKDVGGGGGMKRPQYAHSEMNELLNQK